MAENTENWTKLESDSRYPRKYEFEELEQVVSNLQQLDFVDYKGTVDNYAELTGLTELENGDAYVNIDDGLVYVWNGIEFPTDGNGMDVSMKPVGVVEDGNEFAVSGGEVFDHVDESIKESANKIYNFKGFINKATGIETINSGYETTFYLKVIDFNNLKVSGFSGANNSIALTTFYDENFNRLGYYNTNTQQQVQQHLIPFESIPENTYYIRTTKNPAQVYYISGVDLEFKMATSIDYFNKKISQNNSEIKNETLDFVLENKELIVNESWDNIYSENGYYHKTTGVFTESNDYRSSIMLRLIDRDNLIVTGYSGATNNIALITFYDKNFKRIGYYNDVAPNKHVTNFQIPESSIPTDTAYIIVCKNKTQSNRISGVDLSFNLKNSREWVQAEIRNTEFIPKRNSVPNVVRGGEIKLLNYVGNYQNIHPKVLYFDTPLWGYKYWMAYTPYPNGNTQYENPCISVSNDGVIWEDVAGINPLAPKPETGYNSDTHLVWREDTQTLECWYREYNTTLFTFSIIRRTTTDGVVWTSPETIFDFDTGVPDLLSPAIIFEDGKYKMWYCRQTRIYYRETIGDDITQWTSQVMQVMPWAANNLVAWHLDVIRTDLGLEFIVQAYKVGGNNNTSDLYYVLVTDTETSEPIKIIERGDDINDADYRGVYRSSILKIDDIYYVYYSGIANSTYRAIYLTKSRDIMQLRGVNLI